MAIPVSPLVSLPDGGFRSVTVGSHGTTRAMKSYLKKANNIVLGDDDPSTRATSVSREQMRSATNSDEWRSINQRPVAGRSTSAQPRRISKPAPPGVAAQKVRVQLGTAEAPPVPKMSTTQEAWASSLTKHADKPVAGISTAAIEARKEAVPRRTRAASLSSPLRFGEPTEGIPTTEFRDATAAALKPENVERATNLPTHGVTTAQQPQVRDRMRMMNPPPKRLAIPSFEKLKIVGSEEGAPAQVPKETERQEALRVAATKAAAGEHVSKLAAGTSTLERLNAINRRLSVQDGAGKYASPLRTKDGLAVNKILHGDADSPLLGQRPIHARGGSTTPNPAKAVSVSIGDGTLFSPITAYKTTNQRAFSEHAPASLDVAHRTSTKKVSSSPVTKGVRAALSHGFVSGVPGENPHLSPRDERISTGRKVFPEAMAKSQVFTKAEPALQRPATTPVTVRTTATLGSVQPAQPPGGLRITKLRSASQLRAVLNPTGVPETQVFKPSRAMSASSRNTSAKTVAELVGGGASAMVAPTGGRSDRLHKAPGAMNPISAASDSTSSRIGRSATRHASGTVSDVLGSTAGSRPPSPLRPGRKVSLSARRSTIELV